MNTTFNRLVTEAAPIEFNHAWRNGTGYLDYAVHGEHAPALALGEVKATTDNFGRSVLIIGGDKANMVVFQRHSGKTPDGILVGNFPRGVVREFYEATGEELNSSIQESALSKLTQVIAERLDHRAGTHMGERIRLLNPWAMI